MLQSLRSVGVPRNLDRGVRDNDRIDLHRESDLREPVASLDEAMSAVELDNREVVARAVAVRIVARDRASDPNESSERLALRAPRRLHLPCDRRSRKGRSRCVRLPN